MTTLRRLASTTGGAGFPRTEQGHESGDLPFVKVSDFNHIGNERVITTCNNWVTKETARRLRATVVPTGSVLLPKVGAALLGNARRIVSQPSVFDNNVLGVVPENISSRYLHYWLTTVDAAQFAKPGPVPSMDDSAVLNLRVPVVSLQKQRAISDYLDTETNRIDTLITKKRRMIQLLEERVRIIALGLLTGEGVAKRWSVGPYWLGSVPRTWKPYKVAWAKKTASGTTPESGNPVYYDSEGVPWITTSELREITIVDSDKRVTSAAFKDYSTLKVFPAGTILVAMYGATVGRLGILGIPAATNQACCAVYGNGTLDQQFLYWWLWANRGPLVSMAYGSGQPNISQELIRGLRIPAPDLEEQRQIADRIEREVAGTEHATSRLNRLIDLLAERRQALITSAVTGELAVPGVAA